MRASRVLLAGAAGLTLVLSACTTDAPENPDEGTAEGENGGGPTPDAEWFDQAEFEAQIAQRDIEPEGPADEP